MGTALSSKPAEHVEKVMEANEYQYALHQIHNDLERMSITSNETIRMHWLLMITTLGTYNSTHYQFGNSQSFEMYTMENSFQQKGTMLTEVHGHYHYLGVTPGWIIAEIDGSPCSVHNVDKLLKAARQ